MKKQILLILFLFLGLNAKLFADQCYSAYTPTLSSSAGTTICSGTSTVLSATGNLQNNSYWAWYSGGCATTAVGHGTAIIVTPTATTTYYCRGEAGCNLNGSCGQITITVIQPPATPTSTGASQCGAGSLNLSATANAGETVDWYSTASDGGVLSGGNGTNSFSTPNIDTTTIYYAQARNLTTGCMSLARAPVTATINGVATASASSPQCIGSTLNLYSGGDSSYSWSGPNGFASTQQNPVISNLISADTGIYTVTATGACGSSTATVSISPTTTITSFSPAIGPIGTLVTITGSNLNNLTAFTVGGVNAIVISNTGTQLVGMVMPGAVTGAVAVTGACTVATSSNNFTVTPTLYPGLQQGSKLVGTSATGSAHQGQAVAMSADGNTFVVGAGGDNGSIGALWVYSRAGGILSQQGNKLVGSGEGKIIGTGAPGVSGQGCAVSISADGNSVIAGSINDNSDTGAVWIYTRSGGAWTQQGTKLVGTGAMSVAQQGVSVSISADGNTALVGGRNDNNSAGAVWIYTRSGGVWTQQGNKLVGTGAVGNAVQGLSVSVSADGNTAIVGGPGDNSYVGAAWVYINSGGVWTQQGSKLVGTGATGAAYQGFSVSLSADGNTAMVGGSKDNSGIGAAWVFTRSGGVWTQQGSKLIGTGTVGNANQGSSVSISADGNTALVGGNADSSSTGAMWIYTRSGGVWTQQGNKLVGNGVLGAALQGFSVSVSADGSTAIAGGPGDNSNAGAAWTYVIPTIATGNLSLSEYCAGNSVTVPYTVLLDTLLSGNIFTAQLSDSSGSFASPTNIGSLASLLSGNISATIPSNTPAGTGYRIRVVSSNPYAIGSLNGSNITIGIPTAIASSNSPQCAGNTLNLSSGGGVSYSWTGPAGFTSTQQNPSIANIAFGDTGVYIVSVTNACGTSTATTTVVVNPLPATAVITASGPTTFCSGGSVLLSANTGSGLSYQWQYNGNNFFSFTGAPSSTLLYSGLNQGTSPATINLTCIVSNSSCSSTSNTIPVTLNPSPTPAISGSLEFCSGSSTTLSTGSYSSYLWSRGETTQSIDVSAVGTYFVTATNAYGCTGSSTSVTTNVVNSLPTPTISSNSPQCVGSTLNLSSGGGLSYSWTGPAGFNTTQQNPSIANIISADTGVYIVSVTNACGTATTTTTVAVNLTPSTAVITAGGSTAICVGSSVLLSANTGNGLSYQWQSSGMNIAGDTLSSFSATAAGSYSCVVSNGCGGTSSDTINVTYVGVSTLVLQPNGTIGDDAWISSLPSQAPNNYGTHPDLDAMAWTNNDNATVRGAIRFDVSSIPDNAIVQQATLTLFNNPTSGNTSGEHQPLSGSNAAWLQKITAPWTENTITWDSQPGTDSTNQAVLPESTSPRENYFVDVTTLIQGMVSFPSTNYGFMLRLQDETIYRSLIFASSDNADSTKWPRLSVIYNYPSSIAAGSSTTFCQGGNVTLNASPVGVGYFYQWQLNGVAISGANASGYSAVSTGNYTCIVSSTCSYNSTSNMISVTVTPSTTSSASATACNSYTWNGTTYTTGGSYSYDAGNNASGCDSVAHLNLTLGHTNSSTSSVTACNNYTWNGTTYTTGGSYSYDAGNNASGCDSVAHLNLTLSHTSSSANSATACNTYTWNGTTYATGGSYSFDAGNNATGCDSVAHLNLTINSTSSSTNSATACNSYTWNGTTYTRGGSYSYDAGNNVSGCDSVANINLTINYRSTSSSTVTGCGSYIWNGTTYISGGTYTYDAGNNASRCDSVATLHLTIGNFSGSSTSVNHCSSYTWNGTTYTSSGTYTYDAGNNYQNCDSIATLILTIHHTSSSNTSYTACNSYTWNGTTYSSGGTYTFDAGNNAAGCDSVAALHLTISNFSGSSNSVTTCNSYTWNGTTYTSGGTYTYDAGNNYQNCDSVATLILTVNNTSSSSTSYTACNTYTWNGATYTAGGTYSFDAGNNAGGCDSTATLHLTVNNSTTSSQSATACGSYIWNGTTYTTGGTYTHDAGSNAAGCDSVSTLHLIINSGTQPVITATPSNSTFCGTGRTAIVFHSNVTGTTWSYIPVVSGGTVTGDASGTAASIVQTLANTGSTPATVTYTIIGTKGSCSTTITATAVVNPKPTGTVSPSPVAICSGGTAGLIITPGAVSGTTFSWTITTAGSVTGGSACASSCGNISDVITNSGTVNGSVTYHITPIANGCAGAIFTDVVTVRPVPTVSTVDGSTTICNKAKTDIVLTGTTAGTVYTHAASGDAGITGFSTGTGAIIAQPLYNSGAVPATATYTVTTSYYGCPGSTVTATVTVNPVATGAATPPANAICTGASAGLTLNTGPVSGTTFKYTSVSSSLSTNTVTGATASCTSGCGTSISDILSNGGIANGSVTYSIIPWANGCAGAVFKDVVTVRPVPVAYTTATSPYIICSGAKTYIPLKSYTSGTIFLDTTSLTTTPSGGGTINGFADGITATIAQSLANTGTSQGVVTYNCTPSYYGCLGSPIAVTVTVNPVATGSASPSPQGICSGSSAGITLASGAVSGTNFTWAASSVSSIGGATGCSDTTGGCGTSINSVLTSTATSPVEVYTIIPYANGCAGTKFIEDVTVQSGIPVKPTITGTTTKICAGNGATYTYTVSNLAPFNSVIWTLPVGSTIVTGSLTTNPITISYPSGYVSGTLSASAVNQCGNASIVGYLGTNTKGNPCRISDNAVPEAASAMNIIAYPNPAHDKLNVEFTSASKENYMIRMIDITGRIVINRTNTAQEGNNLLELDMSGLAKGIYILSFTSGDENKQVRVMVE